MGGDRGAGAGLGPRRAPARDRGARSCGTGSQRFNYSSVTLYGRSQRGTAFVDKYRLIDRVECSKYSNFFCPDRRSSGRGSRHLTCNFYVCRSDTCRSDRHRPRLRGPGAATLSERSLIPCLLSLLKSLTLTVHRDRRYTRNPRSGVGGDVVAPVGVAPGIRFPTRSGVSGSASTVPVSTSCEPWRVPS